MGALSTLRITRHRALEYLMVHLLQLDAETLAEMLESATHHKSFNYIVVPDHADNEDERLL